jgi:hypothetical protein
MKEASVLRHLAFAALVLIGLFPLGGAQAQQRTTAIFAGGCFWCMEPPFDKTEGVLSTVSGYTGGQAENPTYEEVSAGSYAGKLVTGLGKGGGVSVTVRADHASIEGLIRHGRE